MNADIVQQINGSFEVKFKTRPTSDEIEGLKKIRGATYSVAAQKWYVPKSGETAVIAWANSKGPLKVVNLDEPLELESMPQLTTPINLKRELFPYQGEGVAYALKHRRVIVGDEPGLGKTGQAIATMEAAGCKCILIICPATLKQNWKTEIEDKWTWSKAAILTERLKTTWSHYNRTGLVKYFIVNYESLKKYFVIKMPNKDIELSNIVFRKEVGMFDGVIIDESHRCKDGTTITAKLTAGMSHGKPYVLALTGTPVVNKPIDLKSQLAIINQLEKFGGKTGFAHRFCDGAKGASNLKELNTLMLRHCFYRRLKKDVLKDLPDKMRTVHSVEITNRDEYEKAEDQFIDYLREDLAKSNGEINTAMRGKSMVMVNMLKKISAKGKINHVAEHLHDTMEAGEKVITFAWHKEIVRELKSVVPSLTITGDDSQDQRNRAIHLFQNASDLSIICNIASGGVGITLTASSRVHFIELPWNPAGTDQCEDRAHRIGQKNSVDCHYFLGRGTIDEYIYGIIQDKRKIVNEVTGNETEIETKMIDALINIFKKKIEGA